MKLLSTKTQQQIEWRREKVLELSSQGHSQRDIADTLHVNKSIISRDMAYLKQQANENLKTHIQVKLPEEYQNCMTGINQVLKICWEIVNKSRNVDSNNGNGQTMTVIDNKTVLQTLALINDCNKYKMDLITNGVVITDAENKESKEPDYAEVKEPDYGEVKVQLEEQQEETGEQETTTNQVF